MSGAPTGARLAAALERTAWLASTVRLALRVAPPDGWGFEGFLEIVCAPDGYAVCPVPRALIPPDVLYDADQLAGPSALPILVRATLPPRGPLDPSPDVAGVALLRLPLQSRA